MKTSATLVSNAPFHISPRINQTLPRIIHILHFCLVDSLLNYVPYFVVNRTEVRAVRRPQIWRDECIAVGYTQLLCMAYTSDHDRSGRIKALRGPRPIPNSSGGYIYIYTGWGKLVIFDGNRRLSLKRCEIGQIKIQNIFSLFS